jgi:hypothetical protein
LKVKPRGARRWTELAKVETFRGRNLTDLCAGRFSFKIKKIARDGAVTTEIRVVGRARSFCRGVAVLAIISRASLNFESSSSVRRRKAM